MSVTCPYNGDVAVWNGSYHGRNQKSAAPTLCQSGLLWVGDQLDSIPKRYDL